MEEKILTSEEVDAILKVSQDRSHVDITNISKQDINGEPAKKYAYALPNINDLIRSECEKNLSALLRKRVIVKTKSTNVASVSACLTESSDKGVFSVFRMMPNEHYGIFITDLRFLHQSLNLLFGGKINAEEPNIDTPGKVGVIVAEKILNICLTSFTQACQEYGQASYELIKSMPSLNLASNLGLTSDEQAYFIVLSVYFDEIETNLTFMLAEDFLFDFIPAKVQANRHKEKDFWRTAIKTQVVDSIVTVNVSLPDVNMKVKDFMELKAGDLIPISDPTLVYICLNSIKLFRASAGQSNSKRVVKILEQI